MGTIFPQSPPPRQETIGTFSKGVTLELGVNNCLNISKHYKLVSDQITRLN